MSEPTASEQPAPTTAGAMLRQARQARGLHVMALSASLKVPASRLEAIEEDRWHELPDAAYARALAHTVSRALGIDPEPVLRGLPTASQAKLESLDEGLNAPFRDSSVGSGARLRRQRWSVVGAGLVLAAGVWWWLGGAPGVAPAGVPAAGPVAPVVPAPAAGSASAAVAAPAAELPAQQPAAVAAPAGSAMLRVVASQSSWIELRDAQGQPRLSRLVVAGEALEQPFAPPMGLTVGNAAATQVWVNGQAIDLAGATRENVARIELR